MAGKLSKWSSEVTQVSMEEDTSLNRMAMDRYETRKHFESNEIMSKEDEEYEAIIENQKRLREFNEEGNARGKTFRKIRGD
ncbi:MAG: hypothetical protein L7S57_04515 [Luminiphilus sp.]|nr:hypothetical protein [Luminiphilus sp.]